MLAVGLAVTANHMLALAAVIERVEFGVAHRALALIGEVTAGVQTAANTWANSLIGAARPVA